MRKKAFTPLEIPNANRNKSRFLTGFTLVEVLVAMSIFMVISGIVLTVIVAGFRSFSQGQKMAERQQRKRFVFFRLSKELSSVTRISYPATYFKGDEKSFFLFLTRKMS